MFILKLLSMRIALFLLLLSIINLTSCKDSHQKQSNEIKVEYGESDNHIEASTIFEKDYQASLLENPIKESSVGGINRVLFADDKIVIVDRMANKLVLFSNGGKYITSTFNMVGQGANEYVHLSDATVDENEKKILGFAGYDCTYKDFFGPTGVDETQRGKGIGGALFLRCMEAMRDEGYGYAIIGSAGPVDFYNKMSGATVIEDSVPGIYKELI